MADDVIIEGDTTEHHHNGETHCEHCVEHAERLALLEERTMQRIDELRRELLGETNEIRGAVAEVEMGIGEVRMEAEEAAQVAEAAAVVALEAAIEEEEVPIASEGEPDGDREVGPESNPGTEENPVTIQVEPEKEQSTGKQPGYGFRRGRR